MTNHTDNIARYLATRDRAELRDIVSGDRSLRFALAQAFATSPARVTRAAQGELKTR